MSTKELIHPPPLFTQEGDFSARMLNKLGLSNKKKVESKK